MPHNRTAGRCRRTRSNSHRACVILLVFLAYPAERAAGAPPPTGPIRCELPDPFRRENGLRVRTPADWDTRRDEMVALLLRYEYGHLPPRPRNVTVAAQQPAILKNGGTSKFHRLRLKMGPQHRVTTTVHLYLPTDCPGPYPAIVRIGLGCPAVAALLVRERARCSF